MSSLPTPDGGPLSGHIRSLIAAEGPIGVAQYMALALGHPRHGYYVAGDPLGAQGDFVTAPEISQVFGELTGLWCAALWDAMGRPAPVRLVELGPGRGTLMADALRAVAQAMPALRDAADLHLVETSPVLRARQAAALADARPDWHESLSGVPDGPMLLIANEFLDALPVRQFVKLDGGWHERVVGLDDAGNLAFGAAPLPTPEIELIPPAVREAPDGAVAEVCPAARAVAAAVAARAARAGGAALFVDYGHAGSAPGETLQAVRGHRYADPLEAPGRADLTAHVDFEAVAHAARAAGAAVHGPACQRDFLGALGIEARAAMLTRGKDAGTAERVRAGVARLVDAEAMGTLFKAMAVAHPDLPVPGFEAAP